VPQLDDGDAGIDGNEEGNEEGDSNKEGDMNGRLSQGEDEEMEVGRDSVGNNHMEDNFFDGKGTFCRCMWPIC
jgi:hypothetical protein